MARPELTPEKKQTMLEAKLEFEKTLDLCTFADLKKMLATHVFIQVAFEGDDEAKMAVVEGMSSEGKKCFMMAMLYKIMF